MVKCPVCKKPIPEEEMKPTNSLVNAMGGGGSDNPYDRFVETAAACTKAWQCNKCGEWVCNTCVTNIIVQHQANQINHSNCSVGGGVFRAPKEGEIIETPVSAPKKWWQFWK